MITESEKTYFVNSIKGETGNMRIDCPRCTGSQKGTLSIYMDTGAFYCFRCNFKGKAPYDNQGERFSKTKYIWDKTSSCTRHPYLKNKGVQLYGLREDRNGNLVVPLLIDGKISTLQFIRPDGSKVLLSKKKGGVKQGATYQIGTGSGDTIYICEGYATGASIYEATEGIVFMAVDAGNLIPVAKNLRKTYPEHKFIFCADNDQNRPENNTAYDVGFQKAAAAARITNGLVCMPTKPGQDFNDLHQEMGLEAVQSQIAAADHPPPETEKNSKHGQGQDQRLQIEIVGGELPQMVDRVEQALINSGEQIFQRGQMLVRPIQADSGLQHGISRKSPGMTILQAVEVPYLQDKLTRLINWVQYDGRAKKEVPKNCPRNVAETLLARIGFWKLPVLRAITQTPAIRPNGTILDTPGYDQNSGYLFIPNYTFKPLIPNPTKIDAESALGVLNKAVSTFPFISDADKSVALAALLTPFIRAMVPAAPMIIFTSPVPGSGKSKLVDGISAIATGKPAAVISQGQTDEETEKRLTSALLQGDRILCLDNIEHPLKGQAICQMITQPLLKVRILGKSKVVDIPSNATLFGTGNNVVISGDMPRRTLLCRLDPKCERPEERQFENDFVDYMCQHRADIVNAALTILHAYSLAGMSDQNITPMGSFESWSKWVRNPLVWLGAADPYQTRVHIRESDPATNDMVTFFRYWRMAFQDEAITVKDAINSATVGFSELYEIMYAIAGDRSRIDPRQLGNWMRRNQDRICGDLVLKKSDKFKKIVKWQVLNAPTGGQGG